MVQPLSEHDFQEGAILLFDKPIDWTSFDVVNRVRWLICKKLGIKKLKVGHAGTLDPKATGLVVVCTGKSTKKIEELQAGIKEYIAEIKLGATTPSFDCETEEDETFPFEHINDQLLTSTFNRFLGEQQQIPPTFSAVKINGVRAFKYAREGKDVKMRPRIVNIESIEQMNFSEQLLTIKIVCSKGTYIRALARDLGSALDSGAYLTGLRRTKSGQFNVDDAWILSNFEKNLKEM